MRKITNLFAVAALVALGMGANAQTTINFEDVAGGSDFVWVNAEGGTLTKVTNTVTNGINPSATCAKMVCDGQNWALAHTPDLTHFVLSASNCKIKVLVLKDRISPFTIKFENANNSVNFELGVSNTKVGEWEELMIDFTAHIGKSCDRIVVIPDFQGGRPVGGTVNLFDNIRFTDGSATALISTEAAGVKVFPNPASDNVTVVAANELSEVKISNLLGQTVKTVSVSGLEAVVALDGVVAGQYIVSVKSADGTVSTQKLVKK